MSEKTRVRLKIVGSEFVVSADEDKDYIVKISNMVDGQIKELLRQSDSMNVAMAAILAALNYCDELEKEKIITQELLKRTETSESLASKSMDELEYLRVENKRLREEKLGLHRLIDELQVKLGGQPLQPQTEIEQPPQQLTFPLDDTSEKTEEEPSAVRGGEKTAAEEEPQGGGSATAEAENQASVNKADGAPAPNKEPAAAEPPRGNAAPQMTARQMLEEKRNALLAAQKSSSGAKNQDRPKPFRPVTSAKSGGGAFKGNGKNEPKINYRDNDKISESFRRSDFADISSEDETLTFFDQR